MPQRLAVFARHRRMCTPGSSHRQLIARTSGNATPHLPASSLSAAQRATWFWFNMVQLDPAFPRRQHEPALQCQWKAAAGPAAKSTYVWPPFFFNSRRNRRKSKPISPKVYAQLLNTKRKCKVHEVSKPMASLSLIPFPFALHSLSSSRSAVTHGHHKPKQGREVSYTNSSQFHKVSPWAKCLKGWVSSKNCFHSLSISSSTNKRQTTHTQWMCLSPSDASLSSQWVRRSSKLLE